MGNAWSHQGLDLECPTSFFGDNLTGDLRARETIYAPVYMTQLIPISRVSC